MRVQADHVKRWKTRRAFLPAASLLFAAALSVLFVVLGATRAAADDPSGRFPNVTLTTQDGVDVRFYDDLIKGKTVGITLIYTTCQYACPLETARMAQVQRLLGDRMGREIFFYSITIDPEHDTPGGAEGLRREMQGRTGWLFLTGKQADIDLIGKKIGCIPAQSVESDGHAYLLVGNEATGQWMRNPHRQPELLARTIGDWLNSWRNTNGSGLKSFAEAPATMKFDRGEYTFANHCAACHSIGRGDHLGPDLLNVTTTREREWLTRFISAPDKVRESGDPIATALRAKFKEVIMPRLDLGTADAELLIDYIDRQSREVAGAPRASETRATTAVAAVTGSTDLATIVGPYLRIQRALNADSLADLTAAARSIAAEASKLGAHGTAMEAAASELQRAADLAAARAAFGNLGDALMRYAKESGAALGADVKVAYCPMLRKYWLQNGEAIKNPFYGQSMSDCGRITPNLPDLEK
jgi:protein SCO1/2